MPRWDAIFDELNAWKQALDQELGDATPREETLSVAVISQQYPRSPWAILVSTILSLRTKDAVTIAASRRVLEAAPNPQALLALPLEELAALAYPVGFYRTKAANLHRIAAILLEAHNGLVPEEMEALLRLPGVGRKTANLVLAEAFGQDAICVDTHVHRIANRMGWCSTPNPDATEMMLRAAMPRKYWRESNGILVLFGQHICRPISPFCSNCPITQHCLRQGVEKSR